MSVCAAPTCSHQSFDGSSYYVDVDVDVVIVSYLSILDTRDDADIRFPKLMLIFRNQRDTKLRWLVSENILDDIIFYILMQSCFDSVRLSSLKY
jgi:hypothetical protein